jgi:hypothetical protein
VGLTGLGSLETPDNQSISESDGSSSRLLRVGHLQSLIQTMQEDYKKMQKYISTLSKQNAGESPPLIRKTVITADVDPYALADKLWRIMDPDEVSAGLFTIPY